MPLKPNPIPFDQIDWKREVDTELSQGRELYALFLVHGFIEAYLRDWLFYVGEGTKQKLNQKIAEQFDRISFKNILLIHYTLRTMDYALYTRMDSLNKVRNDLAHDLILTDYKNKKSVEKTKKYVEEGKKCCAEVYSLYKSTLDKKAKETHVI